MANFAHFQLCDVIPYPTLLAVLGNIIAIPTFMLMGPMPFMQKWITISLGHEFAVVSAFGIAFSFINVSTFGRAIRAITDLGYVMDMNTTVLITGL